VLKIYFERKTEMEKRAKINPVMKAKKKLKSHFYIEI
jgi:hypothetical protein